QYRLARDAWNEAATLGKEAYVADITFGLEKSVRGCWSERLPAIEQDVQRLAKLLDQPAAAKSEAEKSSTEKSDDATAPSKTFTASAVQQAMRQALSPLPRPTWSVKHEPPKSFKPGEDLPLALSFASGAAGAELPDA